MTRDAGTTHSLKGRKLYGPSTSVLALLSLFAGLGLLDRSFVKWRNDPRDFPNANGTYLTAAQVDPELRGQMSRPVVMKAMAASGLSLLGMSVIVFGLAPFQPATKKE